MKSPQMKREELLKENRRLIKNLRARFERQMGVELSAPIYAKGKFNELLQATPRDIRQLNDTELRNLYRDLTYISGLKTATKRGAERAEEEFEPIREFLAPLSKEMQSEWWSIFGKLYEDLGQQMAEKFKYELLNVNKAVFQQQLTAEGVAERMANIMLKYTRDVGGNVTGEGLKIKMLEEFGITEDDI